MLDGFFDILAGFHHARMSQATDFGCKLAFKQSRTIASNTENRTRTAKSSCSSITTCASFFEVYRFDMA